MDGSGRGCQLLSHGGSQRSRGSRIEPCDSGTEDYKEQRNKGRGRVGSECGGGGRKRKAEQGPEVVKALEKLVEPATRAIRRRPCAGPRRA